MRKRILGIMMAACLVIPAGGAIPTASAADLNILDIGAVNYQFQQADGTAIPRKLWKGEWKFAFENQSKNRVHEAVVFKLLDGKTVRQLLSMPQKEAEKHIRFLGATFAKPGKTGEPFKADLTRGRYAMLCFVQNSRKSPPHFAKGMLQRFNVGR